MITATCFSWWREKSAWVTSLSRSWPTRKLITRRIWNNVICFYKRTSEIIISYGAKLDHSSIPPAFSISTRPCNTSRDTLLLWVILVLVVLVMRLLRMVFTTTTTTVIIIIMNTPYEWHSIYSFSFMPPHNVWCFSFTTIPPRVSFNNHHHHHHNDPTRFGNFGVYCSYYVSRNDCIPFTYCVYSMMGWPCYSCTPPCISWSAPRPALLRRHSSRRFGI